MHNALDVLAAAEPQREDTWTWLTFLDTLPAKTSVTVSGRKYELEKTVNSLHVTCNSTDVVTTFVIMNGNLVMLSHGNYVTSSNVHEVLRKYKTKEELLRCILGMAHNHSATAAAEPNVRTVVSHADMRSVALALLDLTGGKLYKFKSHGKSCYLKAYSGALSSGRHLEIGTSFGFKYRVYFGTTSGVDNLFYVVRSLRNDTKSAYADSVGVVSTRALENLVGVSDIATIVSTLLRAKVHERLATDSDKTVADALFDETPASDATAAAEPGHSGFEDAAEAVETACRRYESSNSLGLDIEELEIDADSGSANIMLSTMFSMLDGEDGVIRAEFTYESGALTIHVADNVVINNKKMPFPNSDVWARMVSAVLAFLERVLVTERKRINTELQRVETDFTSGMSKLFKVRVGKPPIKLHVSWRTGNDAAAD